MTGERLAFAALLLLTLPGYFAVLVLTWIVAPPRRRHRKCHSSP